jgi:hypothetical protein
VRGPARGDVGVAVPEGAALAARCRASCRFPGNSPGAPASPAPGSAPPPGRPAVRNHRNVMLLWPGPPQCDVAVVSRPGLPVTQAPWGTTAPQASAPECPPPKSRTHVTWVRLCRSEGGMAGLPAVPGRQPPGPPAASSAPAAPCPWPWPQPRDRGPEPGRWNIAVARTTAKLHRPPSGRAPGCTGLGPLGYRQHLGPEIPGPRRSLRKSRTYVTLRRL